MRTEWNIDSCFFNTTSANGQTSAVLTPPFGPAGTFTIRATIAGLATPVSFTFTREP